MKVEKYMDKVIITLSGLSLIVGIYWFFFGKKEEVMEASKAITIVVDGGYKPNVIKVPKDKAVTLTFLRKDSNSCLEELVLPDYKIKEYLPLNKPVTITLSPPHKSGQFHCAMNMFQGKIVIN